MTASLVKSQTGLSALGPFKPDSWKVVDAACRPFGVGDVIRVVDSATGDKTIVNVGRIRSWELGWVKFAVGGGWVRSGYTPLRTPGHYSARVLGPVPPLVPVPMVRRHSDRLFCPNSTLLGGIMPPENVTRERGKGKGGYKLGISRGWLWAL